MPPEVKHTQQRIEAGSNHANPSWRRAAIAAVKQAATEHPTFTALEVHKILAKAPFKTHDRRALGGVMKEARDLGLISSAGLVRRNDALTRGVTTLWKSCLITADSI